MSYFEFRAGVRPSGIPFEITAVLAVLVAYNCLLALFVLIEVARSARSSDTDYRFDLCLPIRLTEHRHTVLGWTSMVSLRSARLPVPESFDRTATFIAVELFIPGGSVRMTARVTSLHRDEMELQFNWASLAERDRLDQALHAGRWHRIITGRHEISVSPLQWLGLRPVPRECTAGACGSWTPVLVRHPVYPQDLRLAYVREGNRARSETILFDRIQGPIEVVADPANALAGQHFQVGPVAETPLLDEAALEGRGGIRRNITPVDVAARPGLVDPISAAE